MHVQQLFFANFWPHICERKYYENRLSITRSCKPCMLSISIQVHVPTAAVCVHFAISYKLSDVV